MTPRAFIRFVIWAWPLAFLAGVAVREGFS